MSTPVFNGILPSCSYSSEDFTDEKNSKLIFSRGYLICQDPDVEITRHFSRRKLSNGFYLYTHSLCRIDWGHFEGASVTIIGLAYFCNTTSRDKNENIAQYLANIFSKDGREKFLDMLDFLGGSYVVILESNENIELFPDAATLRGVFYSPNSKVVASHVSLANLVVNGETSQFYRYLLNKDFKLVTYYIDDSTDIDGIFRLIPNFSLRFDDFSTQRFYPRRKRKILDFETKLGGGGQLFQVKQELFKAFQIQFQNLKEINSKIVFSITGGRDSGVSFYATREFNSDSFYFTRPRDDDIECANRIARECNLNWIAIDGTYIRNNPYYQSFKQIIKTSEATAIVISDAGLGFQLLYLFPGQWIHIHFIVHETARGRTGQCFSYPQDQYTLNKFIESQRNIARAAVTETMLPRNDQFLIDLATKHFEKLNHQEVTKLGYNPWDFVYLENRDGGWLSRYGDVFDPLGESVSLANCRHVFEIMWQIPDKYINDSNLLYNCIMNEHDPRHREEIMGKNFKPSPKYQDNYALVYGGYMLKGDPIEIAKKALEVNPTIEWAIRALQNPTTDKK